VVKPGHDFANFGVGHAFSWGGPLIRAGTKQVHLAGLQMLGGHDRGRVEIRLHLVFMQQAAGPTRSNPACRRVRRRNKWVMGDHDFPIAPWN